MTMNVRTTEPTTVAYLPMQGAFSQTPEGFGRLYAWVAAHGLQPTGMPAAVYHNIPSDPTGADSIWELQAPVTGGAAELPPDAAGIGLKRVPAMTVVAAIHKGPYDSVAGTYETMWAWIGENGYEPAGPPMERYLNDPGEAAPEEYLTEILMPISKR